MSPPRTAEMSSASPGPSTGSETLTPTPTGKTETCDDSMSGSWGYFRQIHIMLVPARRLNGRRALDDDAEGGDMGFWAFRDKVVPGPSSASDHPELFEQVRGDVPARFEAVGEALIAGRTATDACEVVGRLQGSQGVSLEETLADLRTTYELVLGTEPAFTDACAVALGWSEATLAYLRSDPAAVTGTASPLSLARTLRPDLVLLDVMMPGLDGPGTLTRMRSDPALAQIPVVFMTAKAMPQEVARFRELGAAGVIPKPFDPMKLAQQVFAIWETIPAGAQA